MLLFVVKMKTKYQNNLPIYPQFLLGIMFLPVWTIGPVSNVAETGPYKVDGLTSLIPSNG